MSRASETQDLTTLERGFVAAFVASGGRNATEAARQAGYSEEGARQEGWRLLRRPRVQEAIRAERQRTIGTEGATLAWSVVEGILKDDGAPYGVRLDAAKYIMAVAGHVPPRAGEEFEGGDKSLESMTVTELEAHVQRLHTASAAKRLTANDCEGAEEKEERKCA